ncbi:MAG TPA: DUF302 domain-containing protein [Candidatus Limnocylindria bacterium]|nr:DUF302 domain-containing protein [Candidatus Limnocylindria bacterium]
MNTTTRYTFGTLVPRPLAEARQLVTDALKAEGFGVLTEIDVQATLKAKLDVDRDPYVILGACNPNLAHRAISAEPSVGALLPCNVVLWAEGDATRVEFMDPLAAMGLTGSEAVAAVATEANEKLRRVHAALGATA